ncbi:helix-turn-helix domain-containing protein [Sporosalibacterium faouarense]|uniref:helix-turn-helix domain-containing protein n=1 Tax=Sporosalibacterium faouarense TaxID=516123 RepID=UPI00141C0773|nr:AraC family transcriptional regulator [Sporosalibacterium faouarense]MTI46378.1 helix-turn-helix transcriptional regulator [Bacillota bacterium]
MTYHQGSFNRFTFAEQTIGEIKKYFIKKKYAEGTIIYCLLERGLEMLFFDYKVESNQKLSLFESQDVLEIFYCISGEIILNYHKYNIVLKENMIGMYDFNVCPKYVMLEEGEVKGISLILDINLADEVIGRYLKKDVLKMSQLKKMISDKKELLLAFGSNNIRKIFTQIAENTFEFDREYLLLKAIELILVISKGLKSKLQESRTNKRSIRDRRIYEKAVVYMEENMGNTLTVSDIAYSVGLSQRQLSNIFLEIADKNVYAFLKQIRLLEAKRMIKETRLSITEIAGEVGWQNPSKFSSSFKKEFGYTPSWFRKEY